MRSCSIVLLLSGFAIMTTGEPQGLLGGLRSLLGGPNRGGRAQANAASGGASGGACRASGPNHNFGGKGYLVSWRLGCTHFTQAEAAAYCRSNGLTPISLDDPSKEREFATLVAREGQPWFWTGGTVNTGARSVSWPNGRTTTPSLWSSTGGLGRSQPDNREGNERCLGVLNNFYKDGVKFHDVACYHKKPVICE